MLEKLIHLAFGVASEGGPEILSQTPFLLTSIDWINSVPVCVGVCINIYIYTLYYILGTIGSPPNSIETAKTLTNVSMVLEDIELALSNTSI